MSKIEVDKVDPQSGTALEIGTSGDTVTVPTGAGLTVVDEVKTNKISPATGTAFTLGDSGDTFTVPSGATLSNLGTATGFAGIAWQSVVTGSTLTAVAGKGYPIDTSSNACTVTLPAGSVGDEVVLVDYSGNWNTNNVTIAADGSEKLKGGTADLIALTDRMSIKLTYVDATQGWITTATANQPGTTEAILGAAYNIDILGLAGGRGGGLTPTAHEGGGGGGGAGGLLYSTSVSINTGTVYTADVGAGGPGMVKDAGSVSSGEDSVFSGGTMSTLTAIGGGGGGGHAVCAADGGSGGGGNGSGCSAGGSGTTDQGTDGGNGSNAGGGGGGKGGAGSNAATNDAGAGGAGGANSITGAAGPFAGGGGGGSYSSGSAAGGGSGGGGAGSSTGNGSNATADLGAGGGGAYGPTSSSVGYNGGNGSDGLIILRVLTSDYSSTTTGSPTVSTDGSYTVIQFAGDGTYTG